MLIISSIITFIIKLHELTAGDIFLIYRAARLTMAVNALIAEGAGRAAGSAIIAIGQ